MKFDKRFYIIPAIFIAICLWYPFYNGDSSVTLEQMSEQIQPLVDTELYHQLNDKDLKKYFGITTDEIDGYLAYKAKDTMSAETLLIIHLKDQEDAINIKDKIQGYIHTEHKKYDGYSVDQVRILEDYTMIDKKGYIYLSVIEDDSDWKDTFQNAL